VLRAVWVDHADLDAGFGPGDPDGFGEVGVVADDDGGIAALPEGVKEKVRGRADRGKRF